MYNCSDGILRTVGTMLIHSLTDFLSDVPHFTVIGKTEGGPPTYHRWTKDGAALTNSSMFNTSIAAIPQNTVFRYQDSLYESTLTVVGRHPGLYQYTAMNDLSATLMHTIPIEGIL